MKYFIKAILVFLVSIMSLITVQTVRADDISVTGRIVKVYKYLSIIVIAPDLGGNNITIHGFPFRNLEAQLTEILDPLDPDADGITIEAGDCVTVEYYKKEIYLWFVLNKFELLIEYCENCFSETCYDDDALELKPQKTRPPNCGS